MTSRKHNPNVVAIGGGHGLAVVLKALAPLTDNLTGVVSVADDGGSSGVLRDQYNIPAPGDIRRCISTLAQESAFNRSLEKRFKGGDLDGHPLGNIVIASLTESSGSFYAAIAELSELAGIKAKILPVSDQPLTLQARSGNKQLHGQVEIEKNLCAGKKIEDLKYNEENIKVNPAVIEAIQNSDYVFLGPGSLHTSLISSILIPEILPTIEKCNAKKIFIANIANEIPSCKFDLNYQINELHSYGYKPEIILIPEEIYQEKQQEDKDVTCSFLNLLAENNLQHDSNKLTEHLDSFLL